MRALVLLFVLAMVYIGATTKKDTTIEQPNGREPRDAEDQEEPAKVARVVCYYNGDARKRPGKARMLVKDIDPRLCTHLIYGFANITKGVLEADEDDDPNVYKQFTDLREKNKNVTILLSAGGRKHRTEPFEYLATSKALRIKFANQSISFLRDRNFDGLDVAWMFPDERNQLLWLLQELRKAYDNEAKDSGKTKLLLTALASGQKTTIEQTYRVMEILQAVDFLNVMACNFNPRTSRHYTVRHSSALKNSRHTTSIMEQFGNVESAVKEYKNQYANEDKLNFGICPSGLSFTLYAANVTDLGAKVIDAGAALWGTETKGMVSFFEVCEMIEKEDGVIRKWAGGGANVPYIVLGDQWYGYDNETSISLKMEYVMEKGLSNIMIFTLDLDDFNGKFCGNERFPLLRRARTALGLENPVDSSATTIWYNPKTDHAKLFMFCVSLIFYFV